MRSLARTSQVGGEEEETFEGQSFKSSLRAMLEWNEKKTLCMNRERGEKEGCDSNKKQPDLLHIPHAG